MSIGRYRGSVHSRNGSWKLILDKPAGITVRLSFSGTWNVNRNWGAVDYRGNPSHAAPGGYPLPGAAEGCVVIRVNSSTMYPSSNPFTFDDSIEGEIFLRCNDDPGGLRDNFGQISYILEVPPHP